MSWEQEGGGGLRGWDESIRASTATWRGEGGLELSVRVGAVCLYLLVKSFLFPPLNLLSRSVSLIPGLDLHSCVMLMRSRSKVR